MKKITIIGVGKVGSAMAVELHSKGFEIVYLIDTNLSRLKKVKSRCSCKNAVSALNTEAVDKSDVIIVCLKDDNINNYVKEMRKYDFKGKILLHTSGSLTSDVFKSLKAESKNTGSFHPAQTFSKISFTNNKLLTGISGIEGGKNAIDFIKIAVKKIKV